MARRMSGGKGFGSAPTYNHVVDVAGYVQEFNEAVQTGEWGPIVDYFSDDAVMVFEGPPVAPIRGKHAIRVAYRQNPPTDTIELAGATSQDGDAVVAPYRWTATGEPGTMRFETGDGLITSLVITFG